MNPRFRYHLHGAGGTEPVVTGRGAVCRAGACHSVPLRRGAFRDQEQRRESRDQVQQCENKPVMTYLSVKHDILPTTCV